LNDSRPGTLQKFADDHLAHYSQLFTNVSQNPLTGTASRLALIDSIGKAITTMESDNFREVYDILIDVYLDDTVYPQIFVDADGDTIMGTYSPKVHPYHINFAALMFVSFLTEFELFTLFYHLVPFNTTATPKNNFFEPLYWRYHPTYSTPVIKYRNYLAKTSPHILLQQFTERLDVLFDQFMHDFITFYMKSTGQPYKEIYETIVPIQHKAHRVDTFDYIFVNWKERLGKRDLIMSSLRQAISSIEEHYMKYIAEGTGFFSFMYMLSENTDFHFGSCITYTLFEMYIMSRLHTHADNMYLLLESTMHRQHPFFPMTQEIISRETGSPVSISHWASGFIMTTDSGQRVSMAIRSLPTSQKVFAYQFSTAKTNIFRALIYPVYDTYHIMTMQSLHAPYPKMMTAFCNRRIRTFEALLAIQPMTDV
jgi:hypothetical protein